MRKIGNWLLSGTAVILPVGITIYAFYWGFQLLDSVLSELIPEGFGKAIPGIGIVVLFLFVLLVGILASNVFGQRIFKRLQDRISKIPVIKLIYNPVNKIVSDFSSKSSDSFKKVVLVDFPMTGTKSIGFITNNHLCINEHTKIAVFIPTVPNPTNGHMILVDSEAVEVLDISIAEGINMVITLGSVMENPMHGSEFRSGEDNG